jgi:hypothetical protein
MVRGVDTDDVDARVGEQIIVTRGERGGGELEFGEAFGAKLLVRVADRNDVPPGAGETGGDYAAALAETEDTETEFFHGTERVERYGLSRVGKVKKKTGRLKCRPVSGLRRTLTRGVFGCRFRPPLVRSGRLGVYLSEK